MPGPSESLISGKEILIVDDNPGNLGLLDTLLSSKGYVVRVATNGPEAVASVKAKAPDLLLLDIMMPGMDGFEAYQQITRLGTEDSFPVIFLSAADDVGKKTEAFQMGAADYITKPFNPEETLGRIQTHLTMRTTRDQLIRAETVAGLSSLVSGVAHELNTPLGTAITAASTISSQLKSLSEHLTPTVTAEIIGKMHEANQLVISSHDRMRGLVESFAHIHVDRSAGQISEFDLNECFEIVQLSFASQAAETGTTIQILSTQPVLITSDCASVLSIVSGLVRNSLDHAFADRSAGERRIELSGERSGESTTIEVGDNGAGISSDRIERIYEPFFTTNRGAGHTGLGLTIVINQVTSLGGRVECKSDRSGTRFMITLPAAEHSHG